MGDEVDAATLAGLRRDYGISALDEAQASADPWHQFALWFADAVAESGVVEANAMVLSTVDAVGAPSSRTVLLKGVEPGEGFLFFSNTASRKGADLAGDPRCALLFLWPALQRQVRIAGVAEPLPEADVAAYFASRPRDARLGAWASQQSSPVEARAELRAAYDAAVERFGASEDDGPVPVPPTWGGYRVRPLSFEFWQGRASRLHDRLEYLPAESGWSRRRLAP